MINLQESTNPAVMDILKISGDMRNQAFALASALDKLFEQYPNDGDIASFHNRAKESAKKLDSWLEDLEVMVQSK